MTVSNNWQQASAANAAAVTLSNYAVGAGLNRILLAYAGAKDSGATVQGNSVPSSVLWGSLPMVLVKGGSNDISADAGNVVGASIWALLNPPAETHDVVATWPEVQTTAVQLAACYLTDREQVIPTVLTDERDTTADSAAVKWGLGLTSVPAGAYVTDCCSSSQTGGTHSATELGQVQKVNLLTGSSFLLVSEEEVAAAADILFGWQASVSSGRHAHVIAAFRAAGGSPPPATTHRRVLWAPSGSPQVTISGAPYTAEDANGAAIPATGSHVLGISPIYIFGDVTVTMTPGQDNLLASNAADFALGQGVAGWRYQWMINGVYTDATADSVSGNWVKASAQYWKINAKHQEAVVEGGVVTYAVRKWTVPQDMRVRVSATWSRGAGGDGADVSLWLWHGATATLRFRRRALLDKTETFFQIFDAQGDDVIELRSGVGPALDDSFDDTVVDALIYETLSAVTAVDDDQAPPPPPPPSGPLPVGTVANMHFTNAPTPNYTFNINVIPQIQALPELGIYGLRHNLTMVTNGGFGVGSFAGPWYYDHVYGSAVPYSVTLDAMYAARLYLIGILFEGGSGANYPAPATDVEIGYWADQAYAMVHYIENGWPNLLVAVEVENEPDSNWTVPGTTLAKQAVALKARMRANPAFDHIAIIGPAMVNSPTGKAQAAIDAGILPALDYWSHHHYVPPEKILSRGVTLHSMFAAANPPFPNMKVIVTEFGARGSSNCYLGCAELAMMQACKSLGYTVGASYFPIRDYAGFPNSGYLNSNGSLAIQGQVYLAFASILGENAVYVGADNVGNTGAYSHHFTVAGQHVRVMWSTVDTNNPKPIGVDIVGSFTAKDHLGNAINTSAYMVLTEMPIYVIGNITSVALSATQDTLLADSAANFSLTQGQANWTYQWLDTATGVYTNAQADGANNKWIHPSFAFWTVSDIHMQPVRNAAGNGALCAVRKYTVQSGTSRVRVKIPWNRSSGSGDGSGVSLWHWRGTTATLRFHKLMTTEPLEAYQVIDVQTGDVLEFRVDIGPALDDSSDDTTLTHYKSQPARGALIYRTSGPVTNPQDDNP